MHDEPVAARLLGDHTYARGAQMDEWRRVEGASGVAATAFRGQVLVDDLGVCCH